MKKTIIALLVAIMMLATMIPAFAEPFAGTNEVVPEEIIVPKTATPIAIDGKFEADLWGEAFIKCIATSRAEFDHVINPRDTFLDADGGATTANSDWYFRYDDEYLYICAVVTKPYVSENVNGSLWTNVDDMMQLYFGIDDGDSEGTNDPHCGFGIVAAADCSETWVNCFEQSMPDAADTATVNDAVIASIGTEGLNSIYELAVPLAEALGYSSLAEKDEICLFSGAFFFADDIAGIAYEVGEGVFWGDKKPTDSPLLIAGPLAEVVAAEEPAEEPAEEVVEEPAEEVVEEPAVEEPVEEVVAPAPATTTPAPTTTPKTADISVIFYALAAVSAVGGIAAFRKK